MGWRSHFGETSKWLELPQFERSGADRCAVFSAADFADLSWDNDLVRDDSRYVSLGVRGVPGEKSRGEMVENCRLGVQTTGVF